MKKSRTILEGEAAKKFYTENSESRARTQENPFQDWPQLIGGWYQEEGFKKIWFAFDTTTGEVFCENFDSIEEAKKFAAGEVATTIDGIEI